MKDPYSILGIGRDATDEQIKDAYRNLARKYHPDNYSDDNPLKSLAEEKMQEINAAYDEIQKQRSSGSSSSYGSSNGYNNGYNDSYNYSGTNTVHKDIREKINKGKFREAEEMLAAIHEYDRGADWHFLNAVCLKRAGKVNDAMRELELACSMDPANVEYQRAKEMFNKSGNSYGSTYYGNSGTSRRGGMSNDDVCDCCYKLWCLDCICECMGGDLISCI